MITTEIILNNKLGLHDKACLKIASISLKYISDVQLRCNDSIANGKSYVELMLLSASNYIYSNTSLILTVNGEDEQDCASRLVELVENSFEDAEFPSLKIEELKESSNNFNDYQ